MFYRRFPNNYLEPNFYAEDGAVFATNILKNGFFKSLLTPFNGYFLVGIYILEKVGFIINYLLYDNEPVNLARSFALISYGFLGLLSTLPALLFRRYLHPLTLFVIGLLTIYIPLLGYDYAIIGTIGNLKFAFIYLAFILLVYRHLMPANSKLVYAVDLGILVCAYTNVTVYPMVLFAYVRFFPNIKLNKLSLKKLLKAHTFKSLLALSILLLPQLIFVALKGVPELPGYMDTPFKPERLVEIFVARTYLYGFTFPLYKYLNDLIVLIIFFATIYLGYKYSGRFRAIYIFGVITSFLGTFLFTVKRTGISDFYSGYSSAGPDQFFYSQNLIYTFVIIVLLSELLKRVRYRKIQLLLGGTLLFVSLIVIPPRSGSFGATNFMSENVGNVYASAQKACQSTDRTLSIDIYPSHGLKMGNLNRTTLCSEDVLSYTPSTVSLGLAPYENNYLADLGNKNSFTQTFVSPYPNLDGLNIYFSTFMNRVNSPYELLLYSADCKKLIMKASIDTDKIRDNSFALTTFAPLPNSAKMQYCFSIKPGGSKHKDPLAVQLSKPEVYTEGTSTINGKPDPRDIVFKLHYSRK